MCANFKPLTLTQLKASNLPDIPFDYPDEVYPNYQMPLLFKSELGLEWRLVNFGFIPKWAEDKSMGTKTYNARNETLLQKPTFADATIKCKFGVIPVTEFYESKYIDHKPQRWGIRRRDEQVTFIAALYEIARIGDEIIRSAAMITMDAIDHPMMREFHGSGDIKRSVIVIPHYRLDEWLSWKSPEIHPFIEGFPVEQYECSHVPKAKIEKVTPQMSFFDL